ncbi:hypothetical protein MJO29_005105 [Puccinia striiformis f. sp. tritici]|nr:hypothetical protein MJO29_005105 [Puccinia striiformis f. sp. tritici]
MLSLNSIYAVHCISEQKQQTCRLIHSFIMNEPSWHMPLVECIPHSKDADSHFLSVCSRFTSRKRRPKCWKTSTFEIIPKQHMVNVKPRELRLTTDPQMNHPSIESRKNGRKTALDIN